MCRRGIWIRNAAFLCFRYAYTIPETLGSAKQHFVRVFDMYIFHFKLYDPQHSFLRLPYAHICFGIFFILHLFFFLSFFNEGAIILVQTMYSHPSSKLMVLPYPQFADIYFSTVLLFFSSLVLIFNIFAFSSYPSSLFPFPSHVPHFSLPIRYPPPPPVASMVALKFVIENMLTLLHKETLKGVQKLN